MPEACAEAFVEVTESRVIENREIAPEHFLLSLEAPGIARAAEPGQFVMIRSLGGWDPLLPRAYSVCEADRDAGWIRILYRVVGRGTTRLQLNEAGSRVALWGPLGNRFTRSPAARVVLVGGGVGVPPLIFLAQALRAEAFSGEVHALIGAGSERFLVGLAALDTAGARVSVATDDGSAGHRGYVTELLPTLLAPGTRVHACGPMPMLAAAERLCAAAGVPAELALEAPMACGVGACLGCTVPRLAGGYLRVCTDGPVFPPGVVAW